MCKMISPGESYVGQQGFTYLGGLTGTTAGSHALCMMVLILPDGARAKTHPHQAIETALYIIEGARGRTVLPDHACSRQALPGIL